MRPLQSRAPSADPGGETPPMGKKERKKERARQDREHSAQPEGARPPSVPPPAPTPPPASPSTSFGPAGVGDRGRARADPLHRALAADRRATLREMGALARLATLCAALHPVGLAIAVALHPPSGGPLLVLGSLAFLAIAAGLLARAVTLEARERFELEALAERERRLAAGTPTPSERRLAGLRDPRETLLARAPIQLLALQALLGAAAGVVVWIL